VGDGWPGDKTRPQGVEKLSSGFQQDLLSGVEVDAVPPTAVRTADRPP